MVSLLSGTSDRGQRGIICVDNALENGRCTETRRGRFANLLYKVVLSLVCTTQSQGCVVPGVDLRCS